MTVREKLGRHVFAISALSYILSVCWVLLFPVVCISTGELKPRGTYMSENALMPGGSGASYGSVQLRRASDLGLSELHTALREMGLDVHVHAASDSVYGVLHPTPGADRKECIVLVVPAGKVGRHGTSLVLALLEMLGRQTEWLSKNIVLLAAPDGIAVRSWLDDYHSYGSSGAEAMVRAGVIRGALVLDIRAPISTNGRRKLAMLVVGSNGQLPNMDLVNTVVRVRPRGLDLALDLRQEDDFFARARAEVHRVGLLPPAVAQWYPQRLEALLRFMQRLAFGPTGWHSHFLTYNVDALTLATIEAPGVSSNSRGEQERFDLGVMQMVEQTLHSLSNIEEKLHQSYYLYVFPDPGARLFVSIGEYTGPLVLALLPLAFCALSLQRSPVHPRPSRTLDALVLAARVFGLAIAAGALLLWLGGTSQVAVALRQGLGAGVLRWCDGLSPDDAENVSWLVMYVLIMLTTVFGILPATVKHEKVPGEWWHSLKAVLALALFLAHGVLGILNFPFAMLSALLTVPMHVALRPLNGATPAHGMALVTCLTCTSLPMLLVAVNAAAPESWIVPRTTTVIGGDVLLGLSALFGAHRKLGLMHFSYLCLIHTPGQIIVSFVMFSATRLSPI